MFRSVVRFSLAALLASVPAGAATLPYFEDFDDDLVGSAAPGEPSPESGLFSENTDTQWTVVSGGISGQSYRNAYANDGLSSAAGIDFSGALGGSVATAQSFTLSIDIRFNSGTAGNSTVGLGFLSTGVGNFFNPGYFVDLNFGTAMSSPPAGQLRFVENGGVVAGTQLTTGTPAIGEIYTLTLSGLYVDSNGDLANDRLDLSATISGGTGPSALSGTITFNDTTPATGTFFGIRNRNNSGDLNVDFDNFSVAAVPEPASLALAGFGAMSLLVRRRRSATR